MVRIFYHNGTDFFLLHEEPIPAITKSATVPAFEAFVPLNKAIPTGTTIRVSTEAAETFKAIAEAFDY